jgi:carboxyl-terminal processing protease
MRAVLLILLLGILPSLAHGDPVIDQPLAASVFSTALAFISPRTLEPQPVPQLTLWGLRGLTALDPALVPELREDGLRLLANNQVVFAAPLPADAGAEAWGLLAAQMATAAAAVSEPVRHAGTEGVIRSFFDELFNHLDPYSRYAPPGAAEKERSHRSGEAGLGLTVARIGGAFVVTEIVPGSPASDQDIRPGDRIVSIDGHTLRGESAAAVNALIAGADGTTIRLGWRTREGRMRLETLERIVVPPVTVAAERDGDLLLVTIAGFSIDTDQQFSDLLQTGFNGHRVRGVIIDLRGNRGGLLREAVSVVDAVVTGGVVATTAGRNPQSNRVWPGGAGDDEAQGRPIVVLVDGRSASAAEIMAAAIEDSGRGVVVGSATLGKGLVQTIAPLPDGGELFVTWSRVLAPRGWPLQGLGVMPQVCTSLGEDALRAQLADLLQGRQDMAAALARHDAARAPVPAAQVVELRNACPAAEGRDLDLMAARFLIDHPEAYDTARTPPPPASLPAAAPAAAAAQ